MKKFVLFIFALFVSTVAIADTINLHWKNYDGTTFADSTCVVDSDLILPATTPTRYGYTFTGWKFASYRPIEYLESTGTQYIDTNHIFTHLNNAVEVQFLLPTSYVTENICGVETDTEPRLWGHVFSVYGNNCNTYYGSIRNQSIFSIDGTNIHTAKLEYSNGVYTAYLDNVLKTSKTQGSTLPTSSTFVIFALHQGSSYINKMTGRIYYMKIWEEGTLVRDFIPVLDPVGTPCMYDKVTKQFFYNSGTGDFIAGPVVSE